MPASLGLVVDDDPQIRRLFALAFRRAGLPTLEAGSGIEALGFAQTYTLDFIVTDIEMPGQDGFELASSLRANPKTAHIPIIGLSSLVSADAIERGRQVGLHDYVAKFDRQGLIAALKEQTAGMDRAA